MTINLLARGTTAPPLRPGHRRWLLTVPGLAGLCYTLSWIAGLARSFRVLVLAAPGTPERRVADAMRAHPEWTSGTVREERKLMDAVPGLLIKGGAEGVDAFALSDGRAGAVKIDDGAHRGRTPVTVATLRVLGVAVPAELATVPVIGGEAKVGVIRAAEGLALQS